MTFRNERKNDLERQADELLADDTRRRGSGITRYPSNPGREVLSDDLTVYGSTKAHYDEYPSEQPALLDDNIQTRYLRQMVSKLSPRQQECIERVIFRGWSERQCGDDLGISGGSVSKHLSAGLRRLRLMAGDDQLFAVLFPGLD